MEPFAAEGLEIYNEEYSRGYFARNVISNPFLPVIHNTFMLLLIVEKETESKEINLHLDH